jgi:small GTP-binding protein
MIEPNRDTAYRLIVVGDSCVGKTSIFARFIEGQFKAMEPPTSISCYCQHPNSVDGQRVNLQIWDTAGQERFNGLSAIYFRDADAALFVFALTDASSFQSLNIWFRAFAQSEDDSLVSVVANKADVAIGTPRSEVRSPMPSCS